MSFDSTRRTFVFCCQAGRLETEAAVLVASLRRQLGAESELLAVIPSPKSVIGEVSPQVLDYLESQQVRIVSTENPLLKPRTDTPKYQLLTNKIFCLRRAQSDAGTVVFLDSDQICHARFDWDSQVGTPFFAPRVGHFGANVPDEVLQRCFAVCDAEPPRIRLHVPAPDPNSRPVYVPPWFNSGFIAVDNDAIPELTSLWLDCFQRLDAEDCLGKQRYFTEQLALAIAVMKSGLCYQVADPLVLAKSFLHYFSLERLAGMPHFVSVVRHLVRDSTLLEQVIRNSPEWTQLLGLSPAGSGAEIVTRQVQSAPIEASSEKSPITSAAPAERKRFLEPTDVKQVTKDLPWMSLQQAEFLTQHLKKNRLARCLELGILHGVSTCYLAAAVQHLNGHVHAIDLDRNTALRPSAEELLEGLGLRDQVTIERLAEGATWRLMEWLERRQQPVFDFAYIDVSHTWDITGFLFFLTDRFVRPGGWILFDDVRSYKLEDDPVGRRAQNFTQKQLEVCQVGKVWDLLVTQHPSYTNFTERGNWGLCQKVR